MRFRRRRGPPTATTPVSKPIAPHDILSNQLVLAFPFASEPPKAESKPAPSGKTAIQDVPPTDPLLLMEYWKKRSDLKIE